VYYYIDCTILEKVLYSQSTTGLLVTNNSGTTCVTVFNTWIVILPLSDHKIDSWSWSPRNPVLKHCQWRSRGVQVQEIV